MKKKKRWVNPAHATSVSRQKGLLIQWARKRCQGCGFRFVGHPDYLALRGPFFAMTGRTPFSKGGRRKWRNFIVLCLPCFDGKGEMTWREWRAAGKPQDFARRDTIVGRRRLEFRPLPGSDCGRNL